MSKRPQDTSAEEPDGGNPHIRFRGGPRQGDRPGLLNNAQVRPDSASHGAIRESSALAAHLKTIEHKIPLRDRYENFIGGRWVAPADGGYFDNVSPTTGQVICKVARSQARDVELAIDAAHAAAPSWGKTSVA